MSINLDTCTKEELIEAYKALASKYEYLANELTQLKRMLYGAKSERFVPEAPPEQLRISFIQESETSKPVEKEAEVQIIERRIPKKGKHPVRQILPAHLPRKVIELNPQGYQEGMKRLGTEQTEILDYIPCRLQVLQYQRHKYLAQDEHGNEKVLIAPPPGRIIAKGMASEGLLGIVITDKYLDHIPLHRQSQRFAREKVELPRSTMTGWVGQVSAELQPLYEAQKKEVLKSEYLQVDESSIKVMTQDKEDSTIKGCMQVYHAVNEKQSFFLYTQTKEKENLLAHLKNYTGNLQVDGNVSYEEIKKNYPKITVSHCLAHARRKFEQALENDRERASHVMTEIQRLYAIERRARDEELDIEATLKLRQQEAIPILDALKKWLDREYDQLLPASVIGKAIAYTLKRWKGLREYAQTGYLQIDNNLIENLIRPLALGRKNYLFAGSHDGAKRAAMFYSFFATCKLNNVDAYRWLRDVLIRIPDHPINRIHELLPTKNYRFMNDADGG